MNNQTKGYVFQEAAQRELLDKSIKLIQRDTPSSIVFRAPTGSGKTVITAKALETFSQRCEGLCETVIFWIAPGMLAEQSFNRCDQIFNAKNGLRCILLGGFNEPEIPGKTVAFVNWEKINAKGDLLRRDNERDINLSAYVTKAKEKGKKIVVVIDEVHLNAKKGEGAQEVLNGIIRPDLTIEVSATPDIASPDEIVNIPRKDVVSEGLIRKGMVINPGLAVASTSGDDILINYDGTSENLIDLALMKRDELESKFKKLGSIVKPLVLIQLPSENEGSSENYFRNSLAPLLRHLSQNHRLTENNGVEIWTANIKTNNLKDLSSFNSSARVLFFKQGLATGWDCPRAQILVGLREMQDLTFTTQVFGRIIRQPERRHYEDDSLNYGYLFTNHAKLAMNAEGSDGGEWAKIVQSVRVREFTIPFPSWKRVHADNRSHLNRSALDAILSHKICLDGVRHRGEVTKSMISKTIENVDATMEITGNVDVPLNSVQLQAELDEYKAFLIKNFAAQTRGVKYIEEALRWTAESIVSSQYDEEPDEKRVLETILHDSNWKYFEEMVRLGLADFIGSQVKPVGTFNKLDSWSAQEFVNCHPGEELSHLKKCLYQPVVDSLFEKSNIERVFAEWLDSNIQVKTWIKNGDKGGDYFAIHYMQDEEEKLFYPDWIVEFEDGTIGIYETKGAGDSDISTGNTANTYAKARRLYEYIEELKKNGCLVQGGIVVMTGSDGKVFWVHNGKEYSGAKTIHPDKGWVMM